MEDGGPFTLLDDLGVEHLITSMSPRMLSDMLRGAVHRAHERVVAAKAGVDGDGRRACVEMVQRFTRSR